MCVLTYIPTVSGQCILTHNRDEHVSRPVALPPESRAVGDTEAMYPLDPMGGGTWFAVHHDWVCALLNGGFEPHVRQPIYRRSRGTVITDFLTVRDWYTFTETFNAQDMEPFTLVALHTSRLALYQMVWDGHIMHRRQLDHHQPHIWSSSTLYNDLVKKNRKNLFLDFLVNAPDAKEVFDFHTTFRDNDPSNSFFVRRDDNINTVATIQCRIVQTQYHLKYKTFYAQNTNAYHEKLSVG
jgi:uncharacterized protein with NRDE domain